MAPINPDNTEISDGNVIVLTEITTSDVNTSIEQPERITFGVKIRKILVSITVEPLLLFYFLPETFLKETLPDIHFLEVCQTTYSNRFCTELSNGIISANGSIIAKDIRKSVAELEVYKTVPSQIIPIILILFLGAWSDRTGNRRAILLVPILGELVTNIGMILTTYFDGIPLWVTILIEILPSVLSGGRSIALMGSYMYIATITTVESRTFRIGILSVLFYCLSFLGQERKQEFIKTVGFYGIFGINSVFCAVAFIYVYFRIKNVKTDKTQNSCCWNVIKFFHPKNAWKTISLLYSFGISQKHQIWLILVVDFFILGSAYGESAPGSIYVYLKEFRANIEDFIWINNYSSPIAIAGTAVAVTVFSKLLKMHDALLGIMATICNVLSSSVYALAPSITVFYMSPVFYIFRFTGFAAMESFGTKAVQPEELGRIYSLMYLTDTIANFASPRLYNKIFDMTSTDFLGAFFLVTVVLEICACCILIYLFKKQKQQTRDVVNNPEDKETYAHDNVVTAL